MVGLVKMRVVGNDMEYKDPEEGEKSKRVKFGPVKTLVLWLFEVRVRGLLNQ